MTAAASTDPRVHRCLEGRRFHSDHRLPLPETNPSPIRATGFDCQPSGEVPGLPFALRWGCPERLGERREGTGEV